ncbi:MAG: right-handed parallel beta-helix repeat-containing protein, partial [Gammaproteobacteria bacterium]|nr:right-handed parallel beta-helix repeat-containing protein [Gammaproteobacteria bacterium]
PLKPEDKNVDFGDEYGVPQLLPPQCVGDDHVVPAKLSHVMAGGVQVIPDDPDDPGAFDAPFAGDTRPLCDTKLVRVAQGANAAADFHYFTEVPKAAHVVGGVINDVANEFNPLAPTFGEKFSPPWLPVAFYDYNGNEVTRVYTDQFGKYNAMLPSTNTVNIGSPSGVAPNMLTACMNDSGLVDDPNNPGTLVTDPNHNPQYSQFCYTFQYMPGGTTYLDTPVVSIAAFAGSGLQLDCDAADATPMISSVFSAEHPEHGAYISDTSDSAKNILTINSVGLRSVPNPSSSELSPTNEKNVVRDYGFGYDAGTVWFIDKDGVPTAATADWGNAVITAEFPVGLADGSYQMVVENSNGVSSPMAVTVTVGPLRWANSVVREVSPSTVAGATPIQDALDLSASRFAGQGDIILVAPGTYDELPVMYQPVALQGAGAYSTFINARSVPAEKVVNWRAKVSDLLGLDPDGPNFNNPRFTLLPGQELGELFVTEEGPGLMVVSKSGGNRKFVNGRPSRIDGFTITGASTGGGVFVNGFVQGFSITNNLIAGNQGTYGGGIRLGHNTVKEQVVNGNLAGTLRHPDAKNRNIQIRNNMITRNGVFNGAGGGIAIYTGSQNYRVENNLICGNFAMTDGAGIGHLGLSSGGQINSNQIIFNQSFRQTPGFETDGGGILIAGADSFNNGSLTDGAGHVQINKNLIQGNQAGAGDGAGIALRRVNGLDIVDQEDKVSKWWKVNVDNNTIVNNVAGYAGGALSLKEAVRVNVRNNTISNNESTATAGAAFLLGPRDADGNLLSSSPQVAGIVSRVHEGIDGLIQIEDHLWRYNQGFSLPFLRNNIISQNRSRVYDVATNSL